MQLFHKHRFEIQNVSHGLEEVDTYYHASLIGSSSTKKKIHKTYVLYQCSCGLHKTQTLDGRHTLAQLQQGVEINEKNKQAIEDSINKILTT